MGGAGTTDMSATRAGLLCCGYGLQRGMCLAITFADTLFLDGDRGTDTFNYALHVTQFVALFALLLALRRASRLSGLPGASLRRLTLLQVCLVLVGVVLVCVAVVSGTPAALRTVAGVCLGLGFGVGSFTWLYSISLGEPAHARRGLVSAWLVEAASFAVLVLASAFVRLALLVVLAVASGWMAVRLCGLHSGSSQVLRDAGGPLRQTERDAWRRHVGVFCGLLALGLAFGVAGSTVLNGADVSSGDPLTVAGHIGAIAVAVVVTSLLVLAFPGRLDVLLVLQAAFTIDATVTIALPFAGSWYIGAYNVVIEIVFRVSSLLTAYACVEIADRRAFCRTAPALLMAGNIGLTTGIAFVQRLFAVAPDDGMALVVVTLVVLYAMFMVLSVTVAACRPSPHDVAGGDVREGMPALGVETAAGEALEAITRRYALSEREASVMACLARGRSVAYTADALGLSDNTVKSYAKSLYRKLGVHSKEGLMDLVEQEAGRPEERSKPRIEQQGA